MGPIGMSKRWQAQGPRKSENGTRTSSICKRGRNCELVPVEGEVLHSHLKRSSSRSSSSYRQQQSERCSREGIASRRFPKSRMCSDLKPDDEMTLRRQEE